MQKKDSHHINDASEENEAYLNEEEIPREENESPEESEAADQAAGTARLEEELAAQKDKYLRLVAEFDNYRKRISRERIELMQTASKEVILSLLDVLDDCDRASEQMDTTDDAASVKEGARLIFTKLRNQLHAQGLREMDSLHQDFDAELHDAITEIPAPTEALKGKVIDNIQKGYYLNDKLIRHAKVVVGK